MNAIYSRSEIADMHRKLASIRDQFVKPLDPEVEAFLAGPCATGMSAQMRKTMSLFNAQFCKASETADDYDSKLWLELNKMAGSVHNEVWQFELDALKHGKPPADVRPADEPSVISVAHRAELAGLAFSGGGIRSATFNLGILQALAENRMLRDFDYLSTVSGGGYIGSWFSRWLNKEGSIEAIQAQLAPKPHAPGAVREAPQITFLRQHSNFLTPKTGMFSADTWSMLSIYIRNTLLNLSMLVALMAVAMMLPRLIVAGVTWLGTDYKSTFSVIAWTAALWSVFCIALSISIKPDKGARDWLQGQSQGNIIGFVVLPLMLAGFAGSIAIWYEQVALLQIWDSIGRLEWFASLWVLLPGTLYFAFWAMGWLRAQVINAGPDGKIDWTVARREWLGHFLCATGAYAVGMLLLLATLKATHALPLLTGRGNVKGMPIHLVALGMPTLLCLFGVTMVLCIGLVGRLYSEASREWWARQGAWTIIISLAWLGLCVTSLYGPPLAEYLIASAGGWGSQIMASTWVGATLAGLLLGHSNATGKKDPKRWFSMIAAMAPMVFAAGLMVLVSAASYFAIAALNPLAPVREADASILSAYYASAHAIPGALIVLALAVLLASGALLAGRVDINKFSLYMMYRNRLARAFLGAGNRNRKAHPFTGFDEQDDVLLSSLLQDESGKLQRPFHIINTTLNMVSGTELAWQTRRASGFSFTPAFCGYELPAMPTPGGNTAPGEAARGCFRRTAGYTEGVKPGDDDGGIKLGMAMAVSGAAVSPNMGYHSSPALSFLLTLFNVRLGRWFANPLRKDWVKRSPRFGIVHLVAELFGLSDANASYLSLSDGGHFENLGIYELVRRRCRLIVVVDAGADGNLQFEDLGNAIRKCATDLNIQIDIDVSKVDLLRTGDFSGAHYATGKIRYSQTDKLQPGADPNEKVVDGTLLYIKPSLLGTEPADVLNYRKSNKDFPHQTTNDQWFDETQFESYRALGYRIGMLAFRQAAEAVTPAGKHNRISAMCAIIEGVFGDGAGARHLQVVPKRRGAQRHN